MGGVLMKMHLKKSRKKIVGSLLTIAIISTVIFVANKCYENYTVIVNVPVAIFTYFTYIKLCSFPQKPFKIAIIIPVLLIKNCANDHVN